jgi:LacI family transcriptional regulator
MLQVVRHLKDLGHRRIVFAVDTVNEFSMEIRERAAAFRRAARKLRLPAEVLVWPEEPAEALAAYKGADRPHTAIAAYSDFFAGRILEGCQAHGIRVPEELSLVGFDSTPFCETTSPRLTAVSQPVERMAFEATTHLLALIEGDLPDWAGSPDSRIYGCGLDLRDSTAPPALPEEAQP